MNVWLITWEGTGDLVAEENKIACVLNSRYSDSNVEKVVDILYQRTIFDVHDMTYYVYRKNARLKRFKKITSRLGHIEYEMNPWLYARQVKEFRAVYDTKNNSENVTWVENTIFGNDAENNYQLIEI
jgi:hypothetical protein